MRGLRRQRDPSRIDAQRILLLDGVLNEPPERAITVITRPHQPLVGAVGEALQVIEIVEPRQYGVRVGEILTLASSGSLRARIG